MKKQLLELLAPAGSWEALEAAVNAGANAVYFGGKAFGARQFADNFDQEEITRAVTFAHLRRVRLYVTVNTLVDDSEMDELVDYLIFLSNVGIDGIIVQDMGVVEVARKVVPDLPLHASTQMTITNSAGVEFARQAGMNRVVLARECSLAEIKEICAQTAAEIEIFIHGALCVCYSGQCLMSSLIGGRSGNRGRCAQPCRLPYSLVNEEGTDMLGGAEAGQYLLSPRDLNTLEILPEIIAAGVTSLKIEGRMKRPEYVAVVVDAYRRALDGYEAGDYELPVSDKLNIEQIFNRDFTTAYLEKRPGRELMSDRRPNNRGVLIGRVVKLERTTNQATIKLERELHLDDGLEFWVTVGGRVGATVKNMICKGQVVTSAQPGELVEIEVPYGIKLNDRVFRTFDQKLMTYAQQFYGPDAKKRLPVDVVVTAKLGQPLEVTMTDEEGNSGYGSTKFIVEEARKHALTEETVRKQVDRLGTSEYCLGALVLACDENVMVPMSELNEARRLATEALNKARIESFAPPRNFRRKNRSNWGGETKQNHPHHSELTVHVDTVAKAERALGGGADWIIFGGDSFSSKSVPQREYQAVAKLVKAAGKKLAFATPRIVKEGQLKFLTEQMQYWATLKPELLIIANNGLWEVAQRLELALPLWGDLSFNTYNGQALAFWREAGAVGATLSAELTMAQIEHLSGATPLMLECLVQGRLEMMVSEYCVAGSFLGNLDQGKCTYGCQEKLYLKDRKNERFPIVTDQYCRMHILNAHDLSMVTNIKHMAQSGIQRLRIDARNYSEEATGQIVTLYRQVLSGNIEAKENMPQTTRGHFFRGVL
ncbi:MAG: U32 family peptidase [Acidaminococcaceae bacterium]